MLNNLAKILLVSVLIVQLTAFEVQYVYDDSESYMIRYWNDMMVEDQIVGAPNDLCDNKYEVNLAEVARYVETRAPKDVKESVDLTNKDHLREFFIRELYDSLIPRCLQSDTKGYEVTKDEDAKSDDKSDKEKSEEKNEGEEEDEEAQPKSWMSFLVNLIA